MLQPTPVHCACPDCCWARATLATGAPSVLAVDILADHNDALCAAYSGADDYYTDGDCNTTPDGLYAHKWCVLVPGACPYLYSYADAAPQR